MRTLTARGLRSTPVPRQVRQGVSIRIPVPPHVRHGWLNENSPWLSSSTPRPPHVEQMTGDVPGAAPVPLHVVQAASLVTLTVVVMPLTASRNERCSSASRSSPRRGPAGPPPPVPPRPEEPPPRDPG